MTNSDNNTFPKEGFVRRIASSFSSKINTNDKNKPKPFVKNSLERNSFTAGSICKKPNNDNGSIIADKVTHFSIVNEIKKKIESINQQENNLDRIPQTFVKKLTSNLIKTTEYINNEQVN